MDNQKYSKYKFKIPKNKYLNYLILFLLLIITIYILYILFFLNRKEIKNIDLPILKGSKYK